MSRVLQENVKSFFTKKETMAKKKLAKKKASSTTTVTRKGRKVVTTTTTVTEVQTPTKVALVVDSSQSMSNIKSDTIRMFNSLLGNIRDKDPTAELTVVYFGVGPDSDIDTIVNGVGLSQVRELNVRTYNPSGNTPLYDGVAHALDLLGTSRDYTYLVYVLTDGEENHSDMSATSFARLIREKQATDIFTVVFMVPRGHKDAFVRTSGVHPGNVQEWETSARGLAAITHTNTASVDQYYQARSTGIRGSAAFFTTNLSGLTKRDFNALPDVTGDFKLYNVDKESDIKPFIESKGLTFYQGYGYYSLQKREKISAKKEILLMRKGEKTIKSNGREVLELPDYEVSVNPGNHDAYDIFVQSTSNNRKLPRGSKLLWRVR